MGTDAFSRFRVFAEPFKSNVVLAPSRSLILSVFRVWTSSTRRLAFSFKLKVGTAWGFFPLSRLCRIFHKYGGSGTIQKFDALCVLGMNIINEKVSFNFFFLKVGTGAFSCFRIFAEPFKSDVVLAPSRKLMLSVSWVWTLSTRRLALIPPNFFYIHRWAFSSFWRNSRTR